MRRARTPGVVAAALLVAALLAGCVSVPQEGADSRPVSEPQPDPERRAKVRMELAQLYYGRGQYETALNEVKLALAARPDMPEAYNLRGLILASMGDLAQSEESFQRALKLNPRDADTMHNYAWFMCQQRRYDEADALFERALAQPQYRDAVRSMLARGVCQAKAERWGDAERTLMRAYELDPSNPATAYNLSEVLLRRGELERARFYIRRVNSTAGQSNAQTLWLAARIEYRLGNVAELQDFGRQLRERYPQSTEALLFERGRFNE